MIYRYSTSSSGRFTLKAKIYQIHEHEVSSQRIEKGARAIIEHLEESGYRAYVVGGAIRDLLLGKNPKDFDLATEARPQQIRSLFRRSRIIGRRFQLVHVYGNGTNVVEVSTFRSNSNAQGDKNIFGTLGEDAMRRDFRLNSLFYCPRTQQIIDYVDGFQDIKKGIIRVIGSPRRSFCEDPVRMIRAVKYASLLGFSMPLTVRWAIRRYRSRLTDCSRERLTEEMFKILESGGAAGILGLAQRLHLLEYLLPRLYRVIRRKNNLEAFLIRMNELDKKKIKSRGRMLAELVKELTGEFRQLKSIDEIQQNLRGLFHPLVPSNRDLKTAARAMRKSFQAGKQPHRRVSIR